MKVIELFSKTEDMPTRSDLKARAEVFKIDTNSNIEIIAIPAEYLRNFEFDTKTIANPQTEESQEASQAIQLEKVRVYKSFFPELVDDKELFAQTAEKMGDDPTKIMKPDALPGAGPDEGAMASMQDSGVPTLPTTNLSNNSSRGARGGEQASNDLQAALG